MKFIQGVAPVSQAGLWLAAGQVRTGALQLALQTLDITFDPVDFQLQREAVHRMAFETPGFDPASIEFSAFWTSLRVGGAAPQRVQGH